MMVFFLVRQWFLFRSQRQIIVRTKLKYVIPLVALNGKPTNGASR